MISHIVAVGDIHGQNRKLLQLLRMMKTYMATLGRAYGQDWNFIFLGDYIDYGPDSMEVVEGFAVSNDPVPSAFSETTRISLCRIGSLTIARP
jgi:Calcineurin-like phosphoesterase